MTSTEGDRRLRRGRRSIQDNDYLKVVTGCGRTDALTYEGSNRSWSSLRERLTFELSCADAEIDVKVLSPTMYGVTGCGKKMVYRYVSRVGIVADTAQTTDAPAPKAGGGN